MKFNSVFLVVPLALILASCAGSSSTDISSASSSAAGGTNGGTITPTPTPTPTVMCIDGSQPLFSTSVTGTGSGSAITNFAATNSGRYLVPDSKLRIRIMPVATTTNLKYNKAAAVVTLVHSTLGDIASEAFPNGDKSTETLTAPNTTNTFSFEAGIATGAYSQVVDFSPYLVPLAAGEYYSIRIDQVQTDYACKNKCNTVTYKPTWGVGGGCVAPTSGYCPAGTSWNFDYNAKAYAACCGTLTWWNQYQYSWTGGDTMLEVCQQRKCGVGKLESADTTAWKFTIQAETDSTYCFR